MSKKRLLSTLSAVVMALSVVGTSSFAGNSITANADVNEEHIIISNDHKYQLFDIGMDWYEAKQYCESLGGHLVTITSQDEQNTIEALMSHSTKKCYWLGGKVNNGSIEWITGENADYSYWGFNQPDHNSNLEDTMMIYGVNHAGTSKCMWNDICSDGTCPVDDFFQVEEYGFICEWDNEQPEITKVNPDVTATSGTCCVNLDWNAVDNAQQYAVCGYVNGAWKILAKTADTSYTLQNLKPCTDYKVAVIAMFEGKWYKDFSKAIVVTPVHEYPTVNRVIIDRKTGQAKIEWEPVAGAERYCLATMVSGKWKILGYADADATSIITPRLSSRTVHYFVICARFNGKWDTSNIKDRIFRICTL